MNKVDNIRFLSNFGKTREERKLKRKKMKMIHQIEKARKFTNIVDFKVKLWMN